MLWAEDIEVNSVFITRCHNVNKVNPDYKTQNVVLYSNHCEVVLP